MTFFLGLSSCDYNGVYFDIMRQIALPAIDINDMVFTP